MNRSAASVPAESGVVKTEKYVIPANKTVTVSGDLTVYATDSIEIAGKLVVPRGTSFAFFSPQFTLTGTISSASAIHPNARSAIDSIDACSLAIAGDGGIEISQGDDLYLASSEDQCDVTIGGFAGIHVDPPPSPTPEPGGEAVDGRYGGEILIGSKTATSVIKRRAGSEPFGALSPRHVDVQAPLVAGSGGQGSVGPTTFSGSTCTFGRGGDGGFGGGIEITAEQVNQLPGPDAQIVAGSGGDGGVSGSSDVAVCHSMGGLPGWNVTSEVLIQSNGQSGGSISIHTSKGGSKIGVRTAGNGGSAGAAAIFGLFPPYCTTPGKCNSNGGNVLLNIGLNGKKGTGGNTKATDGAYAVFSATYDAAVGTGYGGSFSLGYPKILKPPIQGLKIILTGFGVGGKPNSNCGMPNANGGVGGTLHDHGAIGSFVLDPFAQPGSTYTSFSGGAGGDGNPAGTGGAGGSDDEHHKIGKNGLTGATC